MTKIHSPFGYYAYLGYQELLSTERVFLTTFGDWMVIHAN